MSPTTRSGKAIVVDESKHPRTYLRPKRPSTCLSINDGLFKVPKSINGDKQIDMKDDNSLVAVSHPSSSKLVIKLKKRKNDDFDALYIPPKIEHKTKKLNTSRVIVGSTSNFPSLATRMSPKGFWYVVQCLETYEQINAIEEIGFIGLYDLKVHMLPLQLCYWLVEQYCAPKNALILPDGQELRLTEEDVHATLGLPMGIKDVVVAKYKCSEPDFVDFYDTWREQFGIRSGTVPIKVLEHFLVNQVEGGYWFKINFVVYVVSTLIDNNQKPVVNHRVLKSLMNVAEIPEYNWCSFVLRSLRDRKVEWLKKKNHFGGPIIFLLLVYVDRVVHGHRTVPRNFVSLSGWTTTLLNAREKSEMKCGQFGIGIIEDRFEEVIQMSDDEADESGAREDPENDQAEVAAPEQLNPSDKNDIEDVQNYFINLATLTKSTAEGLMSLGSMLELGAPIVSHHNVVQKLHGAALNLVKGEVAEKRPSSNLVSVDGVTFKDSCAEERDQYTSILDDDDEVYGLPIFGEAIEAAVNFCRSRSMGRNQHSSCVNPMSSTTDVGSNGSNTEEIEKVISLEVKEAFNEDEPNLSSFYLDPPNLNSINECQRSNYCQNSYPVVYLPPKGDAGKQVPPMCEPYKGKCEGETSTKTNKTESVVEPVVRDTGKQLLWNKQSESGTSLFIDPPSFNLLGLSQGDKTSDRDSADDDNKVFFLGRQIQTRRRSGRALTVECRSPFARGDVNPATKISAHEKMVSDYLFVDCGNDVALNSEIVFNFKLDATRHQFYSLKPGNQVSTNVIDCWAAYLNYKEKERNVSSPLRFFCSTLLNQMFVNNSNVKGDPQRGYRVFKQVLEAELKTFHWIPVRDIDIVFIPVLFKNHLYLYVIDFKGKAFHIIDNRSTRAAVENKYSYYPSMLGYAFRKFFDDIPELQHKGLILTDVKPAILSLKWQNTKNHVDCGIYLMRHMEKFRGNTKNWDCGLQKEKFDTLQTLRVKYACTLVDFELNGCGKDVVVHAKQHKKNLEVNM